jgi:TonB family protein
MAEIEKDLVRWRRGKWLAVIGCFFALQLGAILLGSQQRESRREFYPKEPRLSLGQKFRNPDAADVENPFLFAAASWNGFSGEAWLRAPEWHPPKMGNAAPMSFLNFSEAEILDAPAVESGSFTLLPREKPAARFLEPQEPPAAPGKSQFRVTGLNQRGLMNQVTAPNQYYSDILSNSVVEAVVGADGLVITARLVENSGSPKADADAMALARAARFNPKPGTNQEPEVAKLIFEWFALDLTQTNSVRR